MAALTQPRHWSVAQHFAIWIGAFTVAVGIVGLAINPDFAVGDDATAESFIGVDWNGWHGVAALLVGVPGLATAFYPGLAIAYLAYRAVTDVAVTAWIAVDDRPLGVLFLPTTGDAIFHLVVAAVAALGIVAGRRGAGRRLQSA